MMMLGRAAALPSTHLRSKDQTTLLSITIDVSRGVLQGSDSSVIRASRELQLQRESPHYAHSTDEQLKPWRGARGLLRRARPELSELTLHTSRGRSRMMHRSDGAKLTA